MAADFDTETKLAIYGHFAETGQRPRRPQPDEMRAIFAGLGLTGDVWDPQSDTFSPSL
ncbi:MAG TPA: hypothetical protein VFT29_04670 [Gemmatimonadaceae bacterium]|nr:hypothetical protein [Gemmatimonadaceae bacterium]